MRQCTFEECDRRYYACGYCETHYRRARRHGDPATVKEHRWTVKEKQLCECGCGEYAKRGSRFIKSHQKLTLCECGCGEYATVGRRFLRNHYNLMNRRKPILCECGCGEYVPSPRAKFIGSHGIRKWYKGKLALHKLPSGEPTLAYRTWHSMKQRCNNPKDQAYTYYGGRGIKVCDRWNDSFINFLEDMGERPPKTSIDRIDNDKGYYPENCRWATKKQQYGNRSKTYRPRKKKTTEVV